MKRKYKNMTNRPQSISGVGSIGGRGEFEIESGAVTAQIRNFTDMKILRWVNEKDFVSQPESDVSESVEELVNIRIANPVFEPEIVPDEKEDSGDIEDSEKEDKLLTNDEEMMESEEEGCNDENNKTDSVSSFNKRKKSKKRDRHNA